ncbi:MAG: GNAT family N-acetyltransferase [Bryobacteraceae bacterium]
MLADGYHDVAPGKIAAVVTYLEMTAPPDLPEVNGPWELRSLRTATLDEYRHLFRRVGEDWLWFSRLRMPDAELRSIIHHPGVDSFAVVDHGEALGMLELDRRQPPDVEITFFGLAEPLIGRGAGRWLMTRALQLAWQHSPRRVWLHTCTLDHPRALSFYRKFGFRPYRRGVEIADDPRALGYLSQEAAPRVPLL